MITIAEEGSNHSFLSVWAEESIERELSEAFTYEMPGAEHIRRRGGHWDGRVRMYDRRSKTLPTGLLPKLQRWAKTCNYTLEDHRSPTPPTPWTTADTNALVARYPSGLSIKDYQERAITLAMQISRGVLISPTASGKSLIVYYLVRARMSSGPILIIVPNLSLVSQLVADFRSYGWTDVDTHVGTIQGGKGRTTKKRVVISTWQSIFRLSAAWFDRYESVIGDEAHLFKATSIQTIFRKLPQCGWRIGVTGTLGKEPHRRWPIEGVFGPVKKLISTAELQEAGHLTPVTIQGHVLQHSPEIRQWAAKTKDYIQETEAIVASPARMRWLVWFVGQLNGSVLVLFQWVDKHGTPLFQKIKRAYGRTRPVFFVDGGVKVEDRERIRTLTETTEYVRLSFAPNDWVWMGEDENVPAANGMILTAKDITTDMEIDPTWVQSQT